MLDMTRTRKVSFDANANQNALELEIQSVFQSQTHLLLKQLQTLEEEVLKCASMQYKEEQAATGPSCNNSLVFQEKAELLDQTTEADIGEPDKDFQMKESSCKRDTIDLGSQYSRDRASDFRYPSGRESTSSRAHASQLVSTGCESRNSRIYASYKKRDTTVEFRELSRAEGTVLMDLTAALTERMSLDSLQFPINLEQCKCIPSRIQDALQHVVEHPFFLKIITLLILLNAATMAIEADDNIKRSVKRWQTAQMLQSDYLQIEDAPGWFATVDWIFAVAFTMELACRLLAYELSFFTHDSYVWNWLDFIVVAMAWAEIAANATNQNHGGMPPVRLLRLIRVIRSLRLIRSLRCFAELRLLLLSLVHHVKPLMWSCLTLCLMMFMFANVFLQLLAASLNEHQVDTKLEETWPSFLIGKFASLGEAMVSLFAIITGGDSWIFYYQAFYESNYIAGTTLLLYLGAIILGVLNVISAVFVEAAMSKAKSDHDICLGEAQLTCKEMAAELMKVFHEIDTEDTGHITWQQWMEFLSTQTGQQFILLFEVDLMQARKMYEVLDDDGDGEVVIEEFVTGFMQICGSVNKLDVEFSAGKTNKMMRKLNQLISNLDFHLGAMQSQISQMVEAQAVASPSREDLQHSARNGAKAIEFPLSEGLEHSARSSIASEAKSTTSPRPSLHL